LTRLYRCHFQIENLDKLIFVNKNCPLDLCIGCYNHLTYQVHVKENLI
jgi:hypothetical protein